MKLGTSVHVAIRAQEKNTEQHRSVRILGIDASLRSTGIAIIEAAGSSMKYIDCRAVKNPAKRPLSECLLYLSDTLDAYITEFKPDEAAVEGIFFFRNAKSALFLGHARGTLISICAKTKLPTYEYSPRRIKQAVTGSGTATKNQIQRMMMRYLNLPELPQEDAADALAIAITHLHNRSTVAAIAPKQL